MSVVVFAWGNPSRGDDAAGPRMAEWLRGAGFPGVELIEDFQLQVEHLLDCEQGELLLFIDACESESCELRFEAVSPDSHVSHTSHALSPSELLGYYPRVFGCEGPPAFQLLIPGSRFELGAAMSEPTGRACRQASVLLESLLNEPCISAWQGLAGLYPVSEADPAVPATTAC